MGAQCLLLNGFADRGVDQRASEVTTCRRWWCVLHRTTSLKLWASGPGVHKRHRTTFRALPSLRQRWRSFPNMVRTHGIFTAYSQKWKECNVTILLKRWRWRANAVERGLYVVEMVSVRRGNSCQRCVTRGRLQSTHPKDMYNNVRAYVGTSVIPFTGM